MEELPNNTEKDMAQNPWESVMSDVPSFGESKDQIAENKLEHIEDLKDISAILSTLEKNGCSKDLLSSPAVSDKIKELVSLTQGAEKTSFRRIENPYDEKSLEFSFNYGGKNNVWQAANIHISADADSISLRRFLASMSEDMKDVRSERQYSRITKVEDTTLTRELWVHTDEKASEGSFLGNSGHLSASFNLRDEEYDGSGRLNRLTIHGNFPMAEHDINDPNASGISNGDLTPDGLSSVPNKLIGQRLGINIPFILKSRSSSLEEYGLPRSETSVDIQREDDTHAKINASLSRTTGDNITIENVPLDSREELANALRFPMGSQDASQYVRSAKAAQEDGNDRFKRVFTYDEIKDRL